MSRIKKTEQEEHAQKLKEAFAILTQGVEMMHYDTNRTTHKLTKVKKVVWMDSDILRLCVDVNRPTLADRAKGKIPSGIYMRDIAEVRRGSMTFDFQGHSGNKPNDDLCLSLIATERSVSLELPSTFARDWFYERLLLVSEDILTTEEKAECARRRVVFTPDVADFVDPSAADHLESVLSRGIQVLHHHPSGLVYRSILTLEKAPSSTRLVVRAVDRTFFGFSVAQPMGMKLLDIVEIRPGTHSFGFVGTKSTDKHQECISIIGSECTLDLQLTSSRARDVFSTQLRNYLLHEQSSVPVHQRGVY